jgi:5,10-methenyltetrahydromethanopterin hydrogenase
LKELKMTVTTKISHFAYNFQEVVSFDDGETVQDVTVAYDYLPEEDQYAEVYDVFIFDAQGNNISYDVPNDEFARLVAEAKRDFAEFTADNYAY